MAGMAAHVLLVTAVDGARALLQRRRRVADRGAAGHAALPHRVRRDRDRARRDLRHSARRDLPRRADRRPGARLCLRELRRRLHAAGSRADRRQLPRQSARFPHAGRGLRGHRGAAHADREMGRRAVTARRSPHSPLDVVAWHGNYYPYKYDLRRFSPVGAICCSIIPIRRSSRC